MKILIIADNIDTFNIKKDTTYIMLQQLHKNLHSIYFAQTNDLYLDNSGLKVNCKAFNFNENYLNNTHKKWYNLSLIETITIEKFEVILMRKDPPYNMEYIYTTHLLEIAQNQGVKVINDAQTLRNFPEKLSIFNYPKHITNTLVTKNKTIIEQFIHKNGACILKPLDFMGGYGIVYIDEQATNLGTILDLFAASNNNEARTLMVQKYIPAIINGDKRVIIIGDIIVPYCLTRLLKKGGDSIRSNLVISGDYIINKVSDNDKEIALAVQEHMKKNKIFFTGIDIIGDYLTEVNITSPTGFQEINNSGLFNVGEAWYNEFIKFIHKN